ncbi:MAG: arginyltransferase [Sphingomonadales bacterium]
MTDQSYQFPKFYVTSPFPCPYLPNKQERKVFTDLSGPDASELNESLGKVGFRRSQSVAYRPACEGCSACVSVRVVSLDFIHNKSQRKIWRQNKDLEVEVINAFATEEQFTLLKKYITIRHSEGGMAEMDEFEYSEMIDSSPVHTTIVEYREPQLEKNNSRPGKLIGTALTDVLSDGLSMIYSFFDPECDRKSLGTYIILDHIARAKAQYLPHIYLGYWVKGSPKMDYKEKFQPLERLGQGGWEQDK